MLTKAYYKLLDDVELDLTNLEIKDDTKADLGVLLVVYLQQEKKAKIPHNIWNIRNQLVETSSLRPVVLESAHPW